MSLTYVKQILILDEEKHRNYLDAYLEEPLSFEDFINFMLGNLYDNNQLVDEIIPLQEGKAFLIVYRIQIK